MSPKQSSDQGEYIHCIYRKVTTEIDGDAFVLLAVDNATQFCYPAHITLKMDEVSISKHFLNVIHAIAELDPMLHPTMIMGYGQKELQALQENFSENATIVFDEVEANRVALPVVEEIFGGLR
jgi:hypothetical protein